MANAKKKTAVKKPTVKSMASKKHLLFREIPMLHSLTVVFYILIGILFIGIARSGMLDFLFR